MRRSIIIGFLLLGISGASFSQNCTSCNLTISTAWTSPIAASPGMVICVTPTGSISGDILISGGTVCNEGVISSHNILMTGGSLQNYGEMNVVNLALEPGCSFENHTTAFVDSLSQQGSVVTNNDSLIVIAHSVFNESSFQNLGFYYSPNTSVFYGSNAFNNGIFNCDHLSVYMGDSLAANYFKNWYDGVLQSDSISVWNAGFMNYGSLYVHYDMSLWEWTVFSNYEFCHINRDFFIDTLAYAFTNCMIHIGEDFYNLGMVDGPNTGCGGFSVMALSGNGGTFGGSGNLDLCDASNPGSFDLNTGTLGSNVTFCVCTDSCVYHVGAEEHALTQASGLRVIPNPFTDVLNIEVFSPESKPARLSIFDAIGNRVFDQSMYLDAGVQNVNLDVNHLSPGFYLINLQTDSESFIIKSLKY